MFSLVSGVYQWLFSRPELCILLVGLQGSGKTTFFEQLKERYARNGSKGAAGIAGRPPLGNTRQRRPQDDQTHQQHHEKLLQDQQQKGTGPQGRPLQTVQQQNTRPIDTEQDDSQQKQDQQDFQPHQRQQQEVETAGVVKARRPPETEGQACQACPLPQVSSTTGLNFCRFRYQNVDVILWDLAGVASFHAIWVDYFQNAHCVLYFVDSTASVEGMRKSRTALKSLTSAAVPVLRRKAGDKKHNACPPPLLIVAAKQDLTGTRVPRAEAVRTIFSCEEESCCCTSSGAGQAQQRMYGDECATKECTHHRCQTNAVFPHSACSWDSVEELLRRAVHAAKAHYELLALPLHEVSPASTEDACALPPRACCEAVPPAGSSDEAAERNKDARVDSSLTRPADSACRCVPPVESAFTASQGTQTGSSAACPGKNLSGIQPGDHEAESKALTTPPEVPVWHYGASAAASDPSFVADAAYAHSLKMSYDTSLLYCGRRNDAAPAAAAGIDDPSTCAYNSSDHSVPLRVAAPQQAYEASGAWSAASERKELNREYSGLYDLDGCM